MDAATERSGLLDARLPEDCMLVVNFHHVRPDADPDFPHLHARSTARFEEQLDVLATRFRFATPSQVEAFSNGEDLDGGPYVFLTFDDGLRDHVDHVLPVLANRDLHAAFFICTSPWSERRLLPVHRLHLLAARHGYEALRESFETAAGDLGVEEALDDVPLEVASKRYRYDAPETARIKTFLNSVLAADVRDRVAGRVFAEVVGDEAVHAEEHYMSPNDLRKLDQAGMVVGMHTHRHILCETEEEDVLARDLDENLSMLEQALGHPPRWLSYPYGYEGSYGPMTDRHLDRLGIEVAFTMRRAWWTGRSGALRIPRVDTNDAPGGKRPVSLPNLTKV